MLIFGFADLEGVRNPNPSEIQWDLGVIHEDQPLLLPPAPSPPTLALKMPRGKSEGEVLR